MFMKRTSGEKPALTTVLSFTTTSMPSAASKTAKSRSRRSRGGSCLLEPVCSDIKKKCFVKIHVTRLLP